MESGDPSLHGPLLPIGRNSPGAQTPPPEDVQTPPDRDLRHGKSVPNRKAKIQLQINWVDFSALLVSLIALVLGIVTISPSLPYASRLQYTKQIVIIGFLLGIMNQVLQRVLVFFCLLLERQIGPSSLQNYDGILRWAPLSSRISWLWRLSITLSLVLPLVLSILYKRFTGGVGVQSLPGISSDFAPTVLPGLEQVSFLSIMANATIPYMAAAARAQEPPTFRMNTTNPYGYNIISISNTSAAALDIPLQDTLSQLQSELQGDEVYYLGTQMRGTVATYNATAESHRNDTEFWSKYTSQTSLQLAANYDGYYFGMLSIMNPATNAPSQYDTSWIFIGNFNILGVNQSDDSEMARAFQQTALGFDVKRHNCSALFKITPSYIGLEEGRCSDQLPWQYQYYENSQLGMGQYFFAMLQQDLGRSFDNNPTDKADGNTIGSILSEWLVPTYAVIVASMYQSRAAGWAYDIAVQIEGPIYNYWKNSSHIGSDSGYKEKYNVANSTLSKTVPTLRPDPSLYVIIAIQPILTLIAFLGPFILSLVDRMRSESRTNHLTLPRGFGMISIFGGADIDSLESIQADKHSTFASDVVLTGGTRRQIMLDLKDNLDETEDKLGMERKISSQKPRPSRIRYVFT